MVVQGGRAASPKHHLAGTRIVAPDQLFTRQVNHDNAHATVLHQCALRTANAASSRRTAPGLRPDL